MAPSRVEEVLATFGSFELRKYKPLGEQGQYIEGKIKPFAALGVDGVAALLMSRQPFGLGAQGEIVNLNEFSHECTLDIPELISEEARIELWLLEGKRHPLFFLTEPAFLLMPNSRHPHPGNDEYPPRPGSFQRSSCIYGPHEGIWHPQRDSYLTYIGWGVAWVAAHFIWQKTGVWVAGEAEHNYWAMWEKAKRSHVPCFCNSGREMRHCCTPEKLGLILGAASD